jgi:peroxiredoxin Q/BCP
LLKKKGLEVLGISPDREAKQKKFEVKYKLPFRLIADNENKITDLYGVHEMKKLFGGNTSVFSGRRLLLMKKGSS